MSTFSSRLREERQRLGLNQTELAELAGVQKGAQVNYESGKRAPDTNYMTAILAAGADVNYILTGQRSSAAAAPAPALTPDEREMLALFKSATLTGKAAAIGALQGAAGAGNAPKIHIAGGAHHGQIADVIHNTHAPAARPRPRRSGGA